MNTAIETFSVGGADVAWRETGGEIVILDLAGAVYFGLNGTGAQLWKTLLHGASRADLVDQLADYPGRSATQNQIDVDGFLSELQRCGLLSRSASPQTD